MIDGHHARREQVLGGEEPELREKIREFRADELGHRDTARGRGRGRAGIPGPQALGARVDPPGDLAFRASVSSREPESGVGDIQANSLLVAESIPAPETKKAS